jgi:hypothetical protein
MEGVLKDAGFGDVRTHTVQPPLKLQSAAECARFERESFGALQQMLAALPAADQAAAWDEIEQELRTFEGRGGFEAPTELVVGAGTK